MKTDLKSPCNACPFRKNSAPGYLGGVWLPEDLHRFVMAERPFACHKTILDEEEEEVPCDHEEQLCAGSVMYMNRNAKMALNPMLLRMQRELKSNDHSNILFQKEFLEHHKDAKLI